VTNLITENNESFTKFIIRYDLSLLYFFIVVFSVIIYESFYAHCTHIGLAILRLCSRLAIFNTKQRFCEDQRVEEGCVA